MSAGPWELDTSVVMRLLVGEPLPQYRRACDFLEAQIADGQSVHVSDQVLAEAYFALQSFYEISKPEALGVLLKFVEGNGIAATALAREILALPSLATAKPGFVDRLIHGASQSAGHTLVTFEKAAQKLPATLVL